MAGGKTDPETYAGLTTKEAKYEAVEEAKSLDALDAMWAAWEAQGWSRDGLLYAAILQRRAALGAELSEEEEAQVKLADARWKRAKNLPTIEGRVR